MNTEKSLSRTARLDRIFGTPLLAVLLAILCNALWGSAFPFIKLGYRLFEIQSGDTPPSSALQVCGSCLAVCWSFSPA